MKKVFVAAVIALTTLLYSCERTPIDAPEQTFNVTLNQCANRVFSGKPVSICFDSLLTDSRCPVNAMCVWRGFAAGKFSLTAEGETYPFNLSEFPVAPIYSKDTVIAGYKIEFIDLEPYPGTMPHPVPANKIKAKMKITKQ